MFDDSEAVVNNHDVNLKTPVIKIFSHDFWGTRLTNRASHKSYRPLTILSFRYTYHNLNIFPILIFTTLNKIKSFHNLCIYFYRFNVWLNDGNLSPKSFHVINIILHAIVSCQLFFVYNLLFDGNAPKTSFLASLMFAVHPVHVEVV